MIYSKEAEETTCVAQGVHHGAAPIPRKRNRFRQRRLRTFPDSLTAWTGAHLGRAPVSCP